MTGSTPSIEDLRTLVLKLTPKAEGAELREDTDLFTAGLLNSLSIVQFVSLLEKRFSISFDYNDLRFEHFRTLGELRGLLQKKYGL